MPRQIRTILVTYPEHNAIAEAKSLADTAGYLVEKIVTQKNITGSKYGVGRGKALEIQDLVNSMNIDVIIFDEVLKPTQQYNLSKLCKVETIDRERLILRIFESRASSNESRIQIRLAQLRYDMFRARDRVRLAKKGEQPGFFGMGKYDADVFFLDIKRHATILKRKLEREERRRTLYRTQRSKLGLQTISIAGYTSAGKTTLFNALTGESKDVGRELFTTLSTYTRAISVRNTKFLLSDTVGFISKLPAYMIDAFKSTLSELRYSALVLLVLDISDPILENKRKYDSSIRVLNELAVPVGKIFYVLNKADLVDDSEGIMERVDKLDMINRENCIAVSAKSGLNILRLKELMAKIICSV
jgi:GTP-binding protein HflX